MVRTCIVEACGREYYTDCGLSFHRFPRDANVKEMWIKVIPMSSTRKLTNASVVCSKHFKDQDYVAGLSRPVLKHDAVPSVFLLLAIKKIKVLCDIQIPCSSKSDKFVLSVEPPSKKHCIQQEFINLPAEPLAKKFYQVEPKSNFKLKNASIQTDIKDPYSELLKQKIKILMQKLHRRDIQIKNLQDIKKRKCSNFDQVQTALKNNFPDIKHINTRVIKASDIMPK
ncbi:PREDICTED: THAP domain-containing protein 1-like [Papilio polytes]|uniref:THAP domain-containing protein 1-like n=1 Tax=Papilio polytes TaxID=76194 RepID=UPI0006761E5F|nr:PREDICTED: THAP domain-containing protein 1-like [Papilio polytes]